MTKKIITAFLFALFISSLLSVACKNETTKATRNTDVVTISKVGNHMDPVQFSHVSHEKQGVACITCHHKNSNDDRIKQCSSCHAGKGADETMHRACIKCHTVKKSGPTDCMACHKPKKKTT